LTALVGEDVSDLEVAKRSGASNEASTSGRGAGEWPRAAAAGLRFRPMEDADLPFLAHLYASTRWEELAVTNWSDGQKSDFLRQQFDAQFLHYSKHYAGTDFLVIDRGTARIGRLYLARWAREHRIVDIAVLPEHRARGYGTALLTDLLDEASRAGKAVTIHVEKFNPARSLYRRLGFISVGEEGVYDLMRREPAAPSAP
jgi:ribosomal protein S18 acetylase RimI-like enzyme